MPFASAFPASAAFPSSSSNSFGNCFGANVAFGSTATGSTEPYGASAESFGAGPPEGMSPELRDMLLALEPSQADADAEFAADSLRENPFAARPSARARSVSYSGYPASPAGVHSGAHCASTLHPRCKAVTIDSSAMSRWIHCDAVVMLSVLESDARETL